MAQPEICDNDLDEDRDTLVDEGCGPPTVDGAIADVRLLVDTTGSMSQEIAQIRAPLGHDRARARRRDLRRALLGRALR